MKQHSRKAPAVGRGVRTGLYVDGVPQSAEFREADMALMEVAARKYGHLVIAGSSASMTGAQWIQAIQAYYVASAGVADIVERAQIIKNIRRIMLVDQFPNAAVEPHPYTQGLQVAKETLIGLGASPRHPIVDLTSHVKPMGRAATFSMLHLPPGYAINLDSFHPTSLLGRMYAILDRCPVGPETFEPGQGEDLEANLAIVYQLMSTLGYEAVVTSGVDVPRWGGRGKVNPSDIKSPEDADASLHVFFENLVKAGWDGTKPVYLCRPAPLVDPLSSTCPFEAYLSEELISWRLPNAMVQSYVQRCTEAAKEQLEPSGDQQSGARERVR